MEGEAYFVVSKNPARPFIVNLNGPAIHVLGTSFDVNAYPDNKNITVCLDEGAYQSHASFGQEISGAAR